MASWTPISKAYVFVQSQDEYRPLGVLVEEQTGFRFGYAQSWLSNADSFSVDPLNLPLSSNEFSSSKCWGCFLDSGADNWGQRVLLATRSQAPANQIEWLISARGTGVGSLVLSASRTQLPAIQSPPEFSQVAEIMVDAERLIESGKVDQLAILPDHIQKALNYGSSMGGARPKFTVAHDGSEWICKLSRTGDTFNQPIAELASLNMASDCGIAVPRRQLHDVGGKALLMIERFDRSPDGGKLHYLSARSLLNPLRARDGDPEGPLSYVKLADIVGKVSQAPAEDRHELFTRMVLNVAIGNTDDHLQNHGFLHEKGERYRLSPAFDILPHPTQTGLMALSIGRQGREASLENALTMADRFGLSHEQAMATVEQVLSVTRNAGEYFRQAGASALDAGILHQVAHGKSQAFEQALEASQRHDLSKGFPSPGR